MSTEFKSENGIRVRVFVDFWNFQLSVNNWDSEFKIDWMRMGRVVAEEAIDIVDHLATLRYQGMNVYGSYDASSDKDIGLRRWATNTLNRFPGVEVVMLQR